MTDETNPLGLRVIFNDDGEPISAIDLEAVGREGIRLAVDLAAACHDKPKLDRIIAERTAELGGVAYLAATAVAVRVLAGEIVSGLLPKDPANRAHIRRAFKAMSQDLKSKGTI